MRRKFEIGSQWLYYKIYGSPYILEKFLLNELHKIVQRLFEEKIITVFFFVRFHDTHGHHLRVRLKGRNRDFIHVVIKYFYAQLAKPLYKNSICNFVLDTYCRELNRYQVENIEVMEKLFGIESLLIIDIKKKAPDKNEIWIKCLKIIDTTLKCAMLKPEEHHYIMEELFQIFYTRNGFVTGQRKILADKYRSAKEIIDYELNNNEPRFIKYSSAIKKDILQIKQNMLKKPSGDRLFIGILKDIFHMTINRFFIKNQNMVETGIYFCLSNYYKMQRYQNNL